jgi:hypothetical protein
VGGGCPKAEGALLAKGDVCPNPDPDVDPKALGLAKAEFVEVELVVPNADCPCCAPPPEPLNADCPKTDPGEVVGLVAAVANADGPGPAKAENPPLFAAAPPKADLEMGG